MTAAVPLSIGIILANSTAQSGYTPLTTQVYGISLMHSNDVIKGVDNHVTDRVQQLATVLLKS